MIPEHRAWSCTGPPSHLIIVKPNFFPLSISFFLSFFSLSLPPISLFSLIHSLFLLTSFVYLVSRTCTHTSFIIFVGVCILSFGIHKFVCKPWAGFTFCRYGTHTVWLQCCPRVSYLVVVLEYFICSACMHCHVPEIIYFVMVPGTPNIRINGIRFSMWVGSGDWTCGLGLQGRYLVLSSLLDFCQPLILNLQQKVWHWKTRPSWST